MESSIRPRLSALLLTLLLALPVLPGRAAESPEEALTREILEELGADITVEGIYDVVYYRYDWGPVLILAYRCRLVSDTLHDIGVAEHRWVHPTDLSKYSLLPADQPILLRLNMLDNVR